jgi:hypothetical protein
MLDYHTRATGQREELGHTEEKSRVSDLKNIHCVSFRLTSNEKREKERERGKELAHLNNQTLTRNKSSN